MEKPYILASGNFHPSDVDIVVNDSNLVIPPTVQERIETIWTDKEQEAQEQDLNFYNGTSYRLNRWEQSNGKLFLDFATIQFKERYGLTILSKLGDSNKAIEHKGCFVGANVRTSDGKYILVRLTGKSTNENKMEWLGGIAETDIPCDSGMYLFNMLYLELSEEAGIEQTDIADASLILMFVNDSNHIGFHFDVLLNVTHQTLEDRFKENGDEDIKALNFYNWFAYVRTLQKHDKATKKMLAEYMIEQDKKETHEE